jgi:short-subunit dehydrogenase
MKDPRSVLITGASSGIGEALAKIYAAPGVTLALSGRDATRLQAVAETCRARGATVDAAIVDVTSEEAVSDWIATRDAAAPLELAIANAGVSGGASGAGSGDDAARRIFAVNVGGVVNTVLPTLARMRARGRGQIAIMSSLAGFRGLPGAPAYAASKAAVRAWGEGLAGRWAGEGIAISVICPGFVTSRMTADNPFRMPMLMDADRAARVVRRGLAKGRTRIAFPVTMYTLAWMAGALPDRLAHRLLRDLPAKE